MEGVGGGEIKINSFFLNLMAVRHGIRDKQRIETPYYASFIRATDSFEAPLTY